MFRKSFPVKSVFVLGVLVTVMILVGGCGASTVQPTLKPYCPAPPGIEHYVLEALTDYFASHYPEQSKLANIQMECAQSPCHVIVTNEQSGFKWEGNVVWNSRINEACYGYIVEVISIDQISVTIPAPKSATPITPPPTCANFQMNKSPEPIPEIIAWRYVQQKYPEQSLPSSETLEFKETDPASTGKIQLFGTGTWMLALDPSNAVTITNPLTGFQWKGNAKVEYMRRGCTLFPEWVVSETSVTLASKTPTPTR